MALSAGLVALLEAWIGRGDAALAAELVVLLEVDFFNISTQSVETMRVSTTGYSTKAGDATLPNVNYPSRLEAPVISRSVIVNGEIGVSAPFTIGDATVFNHREQRGASLTGKYDLLLDGSVYSVVGRPARMKIGARSWAYAAFQTVPNPLRVADMVWDEERITFSFDQPIEKLNRTLVEETYGGLGASISLDSLKFQRFAVGDFYDLVKRRPFGVEFRFKTPTISAAAAMVCKRQSVSTVTHPGWNSGFTTGGSLVFRVCDGTAQVQAAIGSAHDYDDDEWHGLAAFYDPVAEEIDFYMDGEPIGSPLDTSTLTGTFLTSQSLTFGSNSAGTNPYGALLDEIRLWGVVRLPRQVKSNWNQAMQGAATVNGLEGLYRCDERGGTILYNEVVGPKLVSRFFGSGDVANFGNNHNFAAADPATILTWVRSKDLGVQSVAFGKKLSSGASDPGYGLRLTASDEFLFTMSDGTTQRNITSAAIARDGGWFGLAFVKDPDLDEFRAYLLEIRGGDLTLVGTVDTTGDGSLSTASQLRMCEWADNSHPFEGWMSNAAIFPAVLSKTEIRRALSGFVFSIDDAESPTPDMVSLYRQLPNASWWPMDENTGTTLNDNIGSVNGALVGVSGGWQDRDGKFAGTGSPAWVATLEGGDDLQGLNKPASFGRCKGVAAPLVDWFDLIYQHTAPSLGVTQDIENAMAGGEVLVEGGGSDYTSDDTLNTVTMLAAHSAPVTLDVKGLKDASGDWMERTGEILQFILENLAGVPTAEIDAVSFATFDDDYPWQIGLYLDTQPHQTIEVMEALMQHRGFWAHNLDGKIAIHVLKNLDGAVPDRRFGVKDIVKDSLVRVSTAPVTFKARLGYQRVWNPISDFVGVVTPGEQQRQSREFRFVGRADVTVKDDHKAARQIEKFCLIHRRRDCETELDAYLDLKRVPRDLYECGVAKHLFDLEIGMTIELTHRRFGLDSPKNFLLAGDQFNPNGVASDLAAVQLYGPFDPEV